MVQSLIDLISIVQGRLNSVLYPAIPSLSESVYDKSAVKSLYNLSEQEFVSLPMQRGLCGESCIALLPVLEKRGYFCRQLFLCFDSIVLDERAYKGFNRQYAEAVQDRNFVKASFLLEECTCVEKATGGHSILEVRVDKSFYVVDPLNGLVYPFSKEALLRNPEYSYEGLLYEGQVEFIKNSIHNNRSTLRWASPKMWSLVRHFGPPVSNYEV